MSQVFIGGCDRSGTTMLGALLGGHSQILTVPESQFIIKSLRLIENVEQIDFALVSKIVQEDWYFQQWALDLNKNPLPVEYDQSYANFIEALVKAYGRQQNNRFSGTWIDHTPANLANAFALRNIFPKARFIHIIRDGRAVAASVMKLAWGPNTIVKAARWWLEKISYGLAVEHAFPSDKVYRIRYEDIVFNPTATLTGICNWLGFEYESEILAGNSFIVPHFTKQQHQLVGRPPQSDRALAWKEELSHRQIELFEAVTADMLQILGYETIFKGLARKPSRFENLELGLQEWYRLHIRNRASYVGPKRTLVKI